MVRWEKFCDRSRNIWQIFQMHVAERFSVLRNNRGDQYFPAGPGLPQSTRSRLSCAGIDEGRSGTRPRLLFLPDLLEGMHRFSHNDKVYYLLM